MTIRNNNTRVIVNDVRVLLFFVLIGLSRVAVACIGSSKLLQDVLNGIIGNHLFLESVSTGLRRLNDLDDLAIGAAFSFLERCNGFLCHESVRLFNFFVYGNFLKNGVVLLQLKTLGCVLAVLGGDVTRSTGHS